MLTALALAASAQAITLRYAPPAGEVATFSFALSGTVPGVEGVDAENPVVWRIAERATSQGPNFLVSRYVAFVNAPALGTAAATAAAGSLPNSAERSFRFEAGATAGKTYRFLIASDGSVLSRKRGKDENSPQDCPSADLALPREPVSPGSSWATTVGAVNPVPARATLREIRPLPNGDEAVIIDLARNDALAGDLAMAPGSYAVLSRRDGRHLLSRLRYAPAGNELGEGISATLAVQRINAPGLAKLKADLGFDR